MDLWSLKIMFESRLTISMWTWIINKNEPYKNYLVKDSHLRLERDDFVDAVNFEIHEEQCSFLGLYLNISVNIIQRPKKWEFKAS